PLAPAVPKSQRAAPNRPRLLMVILAGALGLAIGSVMLIERIDTSFHEIDDLRSFSNVPVLVSIPRIVTRTDVHRRWWQVPLKARRGLLRLAAVGPTTC